jgi:hypothetical protein
MTPRYNMAFPREYMRFLNIGIGALLALGVGSVFAQNIQTDNHTVSNHNQIAMQSGIQYNNNSNQILPAQGEISQFNETQSNALLTKVQALVGKEFHTFIAQGLYPHVVKNQDRLLFSYENEKTGSEAFFVPLIDGENKTMACNIVLGVRNHAGIPTLDFDDIAQDFKVSLDPNLSRLFVELHELAHCEANFIGHEGYVHSGFSQAQNSIWDSLIFDRQGMSIGKHTLHEYFDETYADSYAAVALLKITHFNEQTIQFLNQIYQLRTNIAQSYAQQGKSEFYDPHSSQKSLGSIVNLAQNDAQFKDMVMNDNHGQVAYAMATTLASNHIDELMASQSFQQILSQSSVEFDDDYQQTFNQIIQDVHSSQPDNLMQTVLGSLNHGNTIQNASIQGKSENGINNTVPDSDKQNVMNKIQQNRQACLGTTQNTNCIKQ